MKILTKSEYEKQFNVFIASLEEDEEGLNILRNSEYVELIDLFERTTGFKNE